jgi:hypothetical protein
MGIIVPEGEYSATFVFNVEGITKDFTWSLGVTSAVPISPSTMANVLGNMWGVDPGTGSMPFQADRMCNGYSFKGVSVMLMTDTGPLVGEYFDPVEGTGGPSPLPPQCAVLLNKSTALGGRKYRGRAYIPPLFPAESGVDAAGVLDSGHRGTMQDSYDTAMAGMDTAEFVPVLHHSDGTAGTPITALTVGSVIATQRRRLR